MLDRGHRLLYLGLVPSAFLVLAIGLLLLFWFTFHQEKRNIYISVFFIFMGIGLSFYTTIHYGLGWGPRIPLFMDWAGYDRRFLFAASILVAVIGVLGLVLPRPRKIEHEAEG